MTAASGDCSYHHSVGANSGQSQAVMTMPTALTAKANTMMFCRMMRSVCRDSRSSSGNGVSDEPMRMHVAGLRGHVRAAADGDADVGPGQGRGVVDAVADHATSEARCDRRVVSEPGRGLRT